VNCIVWGNGGGEVLRSSSEPQFSHVQGRTAAAPLFADADARDYRLMPGSPCINTGTNAPTGGLADHDLEGAPRPADGGGGEAIADIGAHEMQGSEAVFVASACLRFSVGMGASLPQPQTLTISNPGESPLNFEIACDCDWLAVNSTGGIVEAGGNVRIAAALTRSDLAVGVHACQVTVKGGEPADWQITTTVVLEVVGPRVGVSAEEVWLYAGLNTSTTPAAS